jgi:hypothetical protein
MRNYFALFRLCIIPSNKSRDVLGGLRSAKVLLDEARHYGLA